jgi:hypothetical protein
VTDPILKKAMDKRDEALREAERWEEWIKAYGELSRQPLESLDIPMAKRRLPAPEQVQVETSPPADQAMPLSVEVANGKSIWRRGDKEITGTKLRTFLLASGLAILGVGSRVA